MTRWATVTAVAAAAGLALLRAGGSFAGEAPEGASYLVIKAPALDAVALDAENARGVPAVPLGTNGEGSTFGVILWDELKPARPKAPRPVPSGQGSSGISATAN